MTLPYLDQDDRFVYMLMELVQGGELEGIMHNEKRDCLSDKEACFYAAGIAEGLCYMHRNGYVYRDLKPQNVLISNEGYPIVSAPEICCDFLGTRKNCSEMDLSHRLRTLVSQSM